MSETEKRIETSSPIDELDAMKRIAEALQELQPEPQRRVLQWAMDRFGVAIARSKPVPSSTPGSPGRAVSVPDASGYGSLPEFFSAVKPDAGPAQALVVAYWLQHIDGEEDVDPQKVNTALKNMGYGISNITSAFDALKNRSPQLVVQTKKTGSSKQARKRFKVTTEGVNEIHRLLAANSPT